MLLDFNKESLLNKYDNISLSSGNETSRESQTHLKSFVNVMLKESLETFTSQ